MTVYINSLNAAPPVSFGADENDDDLWIKDWNPGCAGSCKIKYPKYIRKKYHSPKRRYIELMKYIESPRFNQQFKHRVCKDIHSFGMRVLNPENVYVLSVDEHNNLS